MRTTILVSIVLGALLCSGCYTTKIYFERDAKSAEAGEVHADYDRWYHSVFYGLAEISGPIALGNICPDGVKWVEQEQSFVNGLVEWLTYNIYNPQVVMVYCNGGMAAKVGLDQDGMVVAVEKPQASHATN